MRVAPWLLLVVACEATPTLGAQCVRNTECTAPLVCQLGRCRAECRENRDCPIGARCLLDATGAGACSLDVDVCTSAVACPGGLACIDGKCANLCDSIVQCPSDARCASGSDGRTSCVRVDGDAGPETGSDGGSDGGSASPDAGTDAHVDDDAGCTASQCDPVVEISAGDGHACARRASGAVWCWGDAGGLGDGTLPASHDMCAISGTPCSVVPVRAMYQDSTMHHAPLAAVSIATGYQRSFATLANGRGVVWDDTAYAIDLRDGSDVLFPTMSVIVRGANNAYARIIGAPLSVLGWGSNERNQVAPGIPTTYSQPTSVVHVSASETFALGGDHGCVLRGAASDQPYCWGGSDFGEAGAITMGTGLADPVAVMRDGTTALTGVTELALGYSVSCGRTTDGAVYCWGSGAAIGSTDGLADCGGSCTRFALPVTLPSTVRIAHIYGGPHARDICATEEGTGAAWCWGDNTDAKIAQNGSGLEPLATGLTGVTSMTIGNGFICAIVAGDVLCGGYNGAGDLGRGTSTASESFGLVALP